MRCVGLHEQTGELVTKNFRERDGTGLRLKITF